MALARPGLRAQHVGQKRFRSTVAVQNVVFAALLEIHHELHGDAGIARPMRIGRLAAVAAEVARVSITFIALTEPSGPPAWRTIPSWAVVGTADNVIPLAGQLDMAQHAGAHITEIDAPSQFATAR